MKLTIDHVKQGYGSKIILSDISFEIENGQVTTVLGPNGSGKSTLIKTICNIKKPLAGSVLLDGTDISEINKKEFAKHVAYVPQSSSTFGNTSVTDTVLTGRRPYIDWSYSKNDVAIAGDAMRQMHVDDLHNSSLGDLSGGQRQRVHIARALAQNSDFFVLDEPTSSLDLKHQIDTLSIMKNLSREKEKGAVVALHDLNLTLNYSDKVVILKDSCVYDEGKAKDVVTEDMIQKVYGVTAKIVDCEEGIFVHPIKPVWKY